MITRGVLLAASVFCVTLVGLQTTGYAATDAFPDGCVSCHVMDKAKGQDSRLSTGLKAWTAGKVEPGLLAKSRATAPAGVTLKGKHPAAEDSLEDIPGACLDCHDAGSKKAPPFARMLHLVHLTGGTKNSFVANYKGDCAHCHKLNTQTGEWTLPSGAEK